MRECQTFYFPMKLNIYLHRFHFTGMLYVGFKKLTYFKDLWHGFEKIFWYPEGFRAAVNFNNYCFRYKICSYIFYWTEDHISGILTLLIVSECLMLKVLRLFSNSGFCLSINCWDSAENAILTNPTSIASSAACLSSSFQRNVEVASIYFKCAECLWPFRFS